MRAWLDALGPGRSYHPITLSPLSREETELGLTQQLGLISDKAISLLYKETEGNPLFLKELTRSLVQSQVLCQGPQGACQLTVTELSAAHVPENVRELIAASLRRAPRRARSLLGLDALSRLRRARCRSSENALFRRAGYSGWRASGALRASALMGESDHLCVLSMVKSRGRGRQRSTLTSGRAPP